MDIHSNITLLFCDIDISWFVKLKSYMILFIFLFDFIWDLYWSQRNQYFAMQNIVPNSLFTWIMQWLKVFEFMQLFHFHDMSENPLRCLKFIAVIILGVRMNAKVMKGSLALGNLLCVLSICYASFKLICICSLHSIWIS